MVLVDTSVWIRFFANREPYRSGLDALLARDEVAGHQLIYGELLIGDPGGRESFLRLYESYIHARPISHAEVSSFVRARRLYGRGIGWIDSHLLASTLADAFSLWTADARLATISAELGVAYIP